MRWVCHLYSQLPLEVLSPPADRPCAIVEPKGNRRPLSYVNSVASARGVEPGMSQSSAVGLVPELEVLIRNTDAERLAMDVLACRAYTFGAPVVVNFLQQALWVEVGKSLGLFGGWKPLAKALQEPPTHLPYRLSLGAAPTLGAAYLLAYASSVPRKPVSRVVDLPKALADLPIFALPFDHDSLMTLHGAGLRRIGEVLAIPHASLGKRIGAVNLLALQRVLGLVPEPWKAWLPATKYRRRFDFNDPIETIEELLFPLRIVLGEFVGYLKARDLSVQHFDLRLLDSRRKVVRHPIGLLSPTRDSKRLLSVLRERLDKLHMPDGVIEFTLEADRFEAAAAAQNDLFADISESLGERMTELRERLSARLGTDVVKQLGVSPDQRPERSQCSLSESAKVQGSDHPDRPLWLLPKTERVVPRRILSTIERIELGWWEDEEEGFKRDYAVAEDAHGRLCWVYREPDTEDWHLHGLWQ